MLQMIVLIAACSVGATVSGPILSIDLGDGWTRETQGAWRMRYDHRELLTMYHPWQPSRAGAFASVTKKVTVPANWQGPITLQFYCSDNYHTDDWQPGGVLPEYFSAEGFIGHRYKRVLVNDQVLWDADISDPVVKGERWRFRRFEVPAAPGEEFEVTLLVWDTVDSSTLLEDDFYQSGKYASRGEDPDAFNFESRVYWGNVLLFDEGANPSPYPEWPQSPTYARVLEVHERRWPTLPFGDPWPEGAVRLELSAPAGLPEAGFPVQMGVPFHSGKISQLDQVSLSVANGKRLATQKTVLGQWQDESVKWILFDFLAKPGAAAIDMDFKRDRTRFGKKVHVSEKGETVTVDAGSLQFEAMPGDAALRVWGKKVAYMDAMYLALDVAGETIAGTAETVTVSSAGPYRATVEIGGHFHGVERTVGSFQLRASAYADLPYLRLWLRLFNDTARNLEVSAMPLRFVLRSVPGMLRVPAGKVEQGFRMVQRSEKLRELDGKEVDPLEPMFLAWEDGVIVGRNFRELFPKAAYAKGNTLTVDLVAASDEPIVFTPGEAKSHEIWLAFGSETEPAQFAATVRRPPILQNAEYFCATGVLGRAKTHAGVPVLHDYLTHELAAKRRRWEDWGISFGIRHFPDTPGWGGWANNYFERMLNLWSEWFMSGDRLWYDMAVDQCRHIMDVAVIHSEIPGQDWLGAMHGVGENHIGHPCNFTMRNRGLDLYHKLTGDPDARKDMLGVADFCVRTHAGVKGYSVRQEAGPFDAICTAYADTGDVKYLYAAAERLGSVLRTVDARRGVWPDEHGSKVYRGNIPWMISQMGGALYRYYHLTGDVRAAQALVGLAESIICENTDWDGPGSVSGYSYNPHYVMTASYDPTIVPVIFAAYELTEDEFFLEAATAQWNRFASKQSWKSIFGCHWNVPWLTWYLKTYAVGCEATTDVDKPPP